MPLKLLATLLCLVAVALYLPPARATQDVKLTITRDVPYRTTGGDPRLNTLDIYAPSGKTACPVVIFIHGGGFQVGDKRSGAKGKAEAFPQQGYVFVSINYRLAPGVKHPVLVQDVARAIAWVHTNIAKYGGDPETLFVMGHSAGAQLAALVSTDDQFLKAEGLTLKNLRGTVLLDGGTYDMTPTGVKKGSKDKTITAAFGEDPATWKAASPVYNVAPGKNIPPFLIIYVATRADSTSQSKELATALTKAGVKAEVQPAYNKTHESLNKELGMPGDKPTAQVYAFLGGILGKPIVAMDKEQQGSSPVATSLPSRDVLRTLNLTPEQRIRARDLLKKYKGNRTDPQFQKEFLEILTPEQRDKLRGA